MAPVTYYYFISIILAAGLLFYIINLVYLKKTGRTLYGQIYPIGTPDYKSIVKKLANKRNLTIAVIVELLLIANLIWSVLIVLRLNTPDSYFLLVFAPAILAILSPFMFSSARKQFQTNQFSKGKNKKGSLKHDRDNDSWLS